MIEIAGKNDKVFFPIIISVLNSFLLDESLHFFDLLVAGHKCLHVERHTFAIIASLEVRMEEVQFIPTNFTQVNLRVKDALHGDSVVTHRRKLITHEVRICDRVL